MPHALPRFGIGLALAALLTGGTVPSSVAGPAIRVASDDAMVRSVADLLRRDPVLNAPLLGHVTLAETAADLPGWRYRPDARLVRIRWRSSHPAAVSDRDTGRGDAIVRAGLVRRQRTDVPVRLTAAITAPGVRSETVAIDTVVRATPPRRPPNTAYMFVYFTGEPGDGEKVLFAVSTGNSALDWQVLNGARPIFISTLGTRGLRDPFLLRSAEGDRFFLLATDLMTRGGWATATTDGSQFIEVWESTDLVNWSAQRHVRVNLPNAGMTWAPEAIYDPTIGAYVVYWTSTLFHDDARKRPDGNGPQILVSTTRDFRTFTTPVPWFKAADLPELDVGKGMIDTTVLKDGADYYRFTKVTQTSGCPSPDIMGQRSRSLRAPMASGAWATLGHCIGRTAGTPEVEGPSIFAANPADTSGYRYYLWVDHFSGVGYIPLGTLSLKPPIVWDYPKRFNLPKSPRHGSVLQISAAERAALVAKWGAGPVR